MYEEARAEFEGARAMPRLPSCGDPLCVAADYDPNFGPSDDQRWRKAGKKGNSTPVFSVLNHGDYVMSAENGLLWLPDDCVMKKRRPVCL